MWRQDPGVLVRHTPRSIVLSSPKRGEPVLLTGVAMAVWLCLAEEHSTEALVERTARVAGLPRDAIEASALAALQGLVELGAVVAQ
jgi:hypothetical protein